jgi:hypothetical protein
MSKRIPLLAVALLALTGCRYKPLCYDHHHWVNIKVVYHWDKDPDAKAEGMTIQFHDPNIAFVDEPLRYDLPGMAGGTVRLLPGDWQPISYNNDTEAILFRGMNSIDTYEAYTRSSSLEEGTKMATRSPMPRAAGTENEPVILEPDMLWGVAGEPFTLHFGDSERTIDLYPAPLIRHVYITIRNVPNLQYTYGIGGALSGLAPSVFVASGELGEMCVTQAFEGDIVDGGTIRMHALFFGHCPHQVNTHILAIYAILADNSKWYYTVDVTDQMHDPVRNPDPYHVYIELDDLPIPKPIVNGSGFHPTVDDWVGEEIELTMHL